jgi:hypothetical protein
MALPSVTPLVEIALKELGTDAPTTQSIVRLSATLAQAVARWPGLKGSQKAEMVVGALRELLGVEQIRGKLSAEEQAALRVVVDTVVPETLTLLVSAGRGEFDLRKPTPGCMAALAAALCRTGAAIAVVAAPGNAVAAQAAGALQTAASAVSVAAPASEKEDLVSAPEEKEATAPQTENASANLTAPQTENASTEATEQKA